MLPEIKRFADRLLHPHHRAAPADQAQSRSQPLSELHYQCSDHWRNLLASPMDARHYVLEDWTATVVPFDAADLLHGEASSYADLHNMRRRQA